MTSEGNVKASPLWVQLLKEAFILVAAYYIYLFSKSAVHPNAVGLAFQNALHVVRLEQTLGIFKEAALQQLLMENARGLVYFFNWVYTLGFWPAILTTALVMFIKNRSEYYKYRSIVFISFGLAIIIYAVFPLAPPRMLWFLGFEDTMQVLGPFKDVSGSNSLLYNRYAAMPSMHYGWALLISMIWASSSILWLRIGAFVYQALMFAAIIVTGNHFFVDPIAAVPVIIAAYWIHQLFFARFKRVAQGSASNR